MYRKMLELLTDNYSKDPNSNIGKLFKIVGDELEEIQNTLLKIKQWRDIDKAEGKVLDRAGHSVLEYRNTDNDNIYRDYIKLKIISNLSKGDIETMNTVASFLLKEKYIGAEETWNSQLYDDLAGIIIKMYPNFSHIPSVLNRVKAGGVKLYWETEMESDVLEIVTEQNDTTFDYPMTNRFTTASQKGKVLREPIYLHTKEKATAFDYPLTNEFSPQGKSSVKASTLDIKTNTKFNKVIYPLCGEFSMGEVI